MSIAACGCQCGGTESLIRNFLKSTGYQDWLNIPIMQGRDKSLTLLNQLPPTPEKEMLQNFFKDASKWAVIIGYTDTDMRWSDIAHNGPKARIEAEFVVKNFDN